MSEKKFKGTGVALVTPFTASKEVDYPSLEKLVHYVIENGVDFLVVLGTTAETPTLLREEKRDILEFVIETNKQRIPVVCGIGGNNTRDVIEQFSYYPLDKVDGILSVSPYYNKPSMEGVFQHFNMLNKETPRPIILYNVPGRTGSNVTPATTIRIAHECENIVAIKEACGSITQGMELAMNVPAHFSLLSGDDNLILPQISCGFDGVISVAANCWTRDFTNMVNTALAGDFHKARELHYKLLKGIDLLFIEGNPPGVKHVLHQMGMCENEFRLPVVPVSAEAGQMLYSFIKTL